MDHLTYAIVDVGTDLQNIDFSQVGETSSLTVRKSVDGTLFVIKYPSEPTFIENGTVTPSQILTYSECLALMATPEWSPGDPT